MRFLSIGLLPFFFFPLLPMSPAAPVSERAVEAPASPAPTGRSIRVTRREPRTHGHRAAPSGCFEAAVPSYASTSFGKPNRGRLARGKFLPESEVIRHVDAQDCNFWGTDELTGVVERIARKIAVEHPGARLTVGELSKRNGGDIEGHNSHENGRDVDLGFYWVDEDGRPYEPRRLVNVHRDKTTIVDGKTLTFDVARNWKIVEGFLTDDESDLNIILINARIRRWLLDHARESGVSSELRRRASIVMRVPRRGAHPHLNHFHVRIYCPEADGECRDFNGLWRWVEEARVDRARENEALASR